MQGQTYLKQMGLFCGVTMIPGAFEELRRAYTKQYSILDIKNKLLKPGQDLTKMTREDELPWFKEFKNIVDLDANIPKIVKQAKKSSWLNTKIQLKGVYDQDREILIGPVQMKDNLDIIDDQFFQMVQTPFRIYGQDGIKTDKSILVERGWLPASLKNHRSKINMIKGVTSIEGVLRPSHQNPMAMNNSLLDEWTSLKLNEIGLACQVVNIDEFSCFQVKQLQFEENKLKYEVEEAGDYKIADVDCDSYEIDVNIKSTTDKEEKRENKLLHEVFPVKDSIKNLTLSNVSPERHFMYFVQMLLIGQIGILAQRRKVKFNLKI